MANEEHVRRLKQSIRKWDTWRQAHPAAQIDLSGADLSETTLSWADLSGADLSETDLSGATFSWADLSGADLSGADLSGATFREAKLFQVKLTRAKLTRAILRKITLGGADLSGAKLTGADLSGADLSGADLSGADLSGAKLFQARLFQARLTGADLTGAKLTGATLSGADLSGAYLSEATLREADLSGAYFDGTYLTMADLSGATLSGADLSGAYLGGTIFSQVDLRQTKGLLEIHHKGPSILALPTLQLPPDDNTLHFLREAGVPDEWIGFYRSTNMSPIQYHSCFISYSSKDEAFAKRLYADLQSNNVRCWFAPEDLKWGADIRTGIDEAIHIHEKLLLILSEHAIESGWVEHEIQRAFEKEGKQQRLVLFPIRVDQAILDCPYSWATTIRHKRNIGDFTHWKEHDAYTQSFNRLMRDLKAE